MAYIDKLNFVQKCYDLVQEDICRCLPDKPHSAQIIAECMEEADASGLMTFPEFAELYNECNRIAMLKRDLIGEL